MPPLQARCAAALVVVAGLAVAAGAGARVRGPGPQDPSQWADIFNRDANNPNKAVSRDLSRALGRHVGAPPPHARRR